MESWTCGLAILLGAAALWMASDPEGERPLVAGCASVSLGALEARAAARPDDAESTGALAQAYLDARMPGAAIALVEAAADPVRADLRVRHVYARAQVDRGSVHQALAIEQQIIEACGRDFSSTPAPVGCDPVLLASATRRAAILEQLVAMGVEDAQAEPEMSRIAYRNATREARIATE